MSFEPFLIANFRVGLENNSASWLGPEEAMTDIDNMYLRRGIITKREGQSVWGQLGDLTTGETSWTNVSGNNYTRTLSNPTIVRRSFKVYDDGGSIVVRDDGQGALTGDVDAGGTNTIDYVTGAVDVTFDGAISGTVTGEYSTAHTRATRAIKNYDRYSGSDLLLGLDSTRLSKWNTTNDFFENVADGSSNYDLWNSTNQVWVEAFGDFIWIADNSTLSAGSPPTGGVKVFNGSVISDPDLDLDAAGTPTAIKGALMIFLYKERLVMLNTIEGTSNTRYPQRARWSAIGVTPTTTQGWFDPDLSGIFGKGGRNDAPTNDEIVSAGFVGERLIVWCENSVFALDSTSNPDLPFVWRQLSTTRQCSSTFASVEYDSYVTAMGGKGIIMCDGQNVQAFDKKIPDFIFEVDQDNVTLAAAIRSDRLDQSLMAYPSAPTSTANDKMLGFNYEDGAFFNYTLAAHCFGSWLTPVDLTFDDYAGVTYDELSAIDWGEAGLQGGFPIILSGGDNGYVFRINDSDELADSLTWAEEFEEGGSTPENFDFSLTTKRLNPFKNQKVHLGYVRLMVQRINSASITCDFFINQDNEVVRSETVSMDNDTESGDKIWVTVPADLNANFVRMKFYLSAAQLAVDANAQSQVRIHAIQLWAKEGGRLEEL
jgi:hypothetical protein